MRDSYIVNPGAERPLHSPAPRTAATTVTRTPLELAWDRFQDRLVFNRPRRLDVLNTGRNLAGRACDIDAQFRACQDWLTALVEDTCPHVGLRAAELVRLIEQMQDIAADVRGPIVDAIHGTVTTRAA